MAIRVVGEYSSAVYEKADRWYVSEEGYLLVGVGGTQAIFQPLIAEFAPNCWSRVEVVNKDV